MVPDVEKSNLKSTFVVKDVNVNISNVSTPTVQEETDTKNQDLNENSINNTVNTTNTVSQE